MAAALFERRIEALDQPVTVSSAGIRRTASVVPEEVDMVMAPYGLDLSGHRPQLLTAELVVEADLIIGMERRHVHEAILLDPPCWPHCFTLKELVRRGEEVGPRRPDQGIRSWIDAVQGDRSRLSLAHRKRSEEVADPFGRSLDRFTGTAAELDDLTGRLAGLLWGAELGHPG
jgi:protein-tyrosine-phosphatase